MIITMESKNELTIPLSYNHQLQSAIYAKLREVGESDFWHNCGFVSDKLYKEFVFGRLCGAYSIADKKLTFRGEISLELRSPLLPFCDSFQRSLELNPRIKLFDTFLDVTSATLLNQHINTSEATFTTISPVVSHVTDSDGHTIFFGPDDAEFSDRLESNFVRKYSALTGCLPAPISIQPLGTHKKTVTKFKSTWVTAWQGNYRICGSYDCLEFLYNAGLGEKNSQGFGLLGLVE